MAYTVLGTGDSGGVESAGKSELQPIPQNYAPQRVEKEKDFPSLKGHHILKVQGHLPTGRAVEEGNLEREIPRDGVPGNMSLIPC